MSGYKIKGCFVVKKFFFLLRSISLYVTSVDLSIIWYGPCRSSCNFLEIPFVS